VLIQLQDTPLDVANYFCAGADTLHWGMFDEYGVPSSTYWAFRAFNELTKTPVRVSITAPPSIYVCAGLSDDKQQAGLLLANHKTPQAQWTVSVRNVPLTGKVRLQQYLVDERHEFSLARDEALADPQCVLHLNLAPSSVCYLRFFNEK